MDNDQEVVREPFEDQRDDPDSGSPFSASSHQPKYDEQMYQDAQEGTMAENDLLDKISSSSNVRHLDEPDGHYKDDDDDNSSIASASDVEFAKSYGINLKSSKSEQSYKRLMESVHFKSSAGKGAETPNADQQRLTRPVLDSSVTSDCIYHKGTFYQKGDIVALCDQDDGQVYFAQLTGFLQDQYCEKSGSLRWLVPTRPTSRDFFDPSAYTIGLEDVQLRKLDCMTFVRHCPHDYYLRKFFSSSSSLAGADNADDAILPAHNQQAAKSYSSQSNLDHRPLSSTSCSSKGQGYIWTTMETCRVPRIQVNKRK